MQEGYTIAFSLVQSYRNSLAYSFRIINPFSIRPVPVIGSYDQCQVQYMAVLLTWKLRTVPSAGDWPCRIGAFFEHEILTV